jgi:glycosyltransferase involved in cell wall biosynthesis
MRGLETKGISVIVTADRNELHVFECLKSIHEQSRKPDEIIFVYNNFSEITLQAVKLQFPTVTFLKTKAQSASAARNAGILNSTGDILCLLDGDDLWSPRKLEQQELLIKKLDLDLVYSGGIEVSASLRVIREHFPSVRGSRLNALHFAPTRALVTLGCSSVMLKRSLISSVGQFDENLTSFAEDLEFFARCLSQAKVDYTPFPLVIYRRHARNESNKSILRFIFWNWKSGILMTRRLTDTKGNKARFLVRLFISLLKNLLKH